MNAIVQRPMPPYLVDYHADLQREVYNGKLNTREVPGQVFYEWYRWFKDNDPSMSLLDPLQSNTGEPIWNFDIESLMSFFEHWVVKGRPVT